MNDFAKSLNELLLIFGLKAPVVMAGFFGGVLRAISRKSYTLREMVASPICGLLAAGYLTDPVLHYLNIIRFPMPSGDEQAISTNASAFIIGVSGMWISDLVFVYIQGKLKQK